VERAGFAVAVPNEVASAPVAGLADGLDGDGRRTSAGARDARVLAVGDIQGVRVGRVDPLATGAEGPALVIAHPRVGDEMRCRHLAITRRLRRWATSRTRGMTGVRFAAAYMAAVANEGMAAGEGSFTP